MTTLPTLISTQKIDNKRQTWTIRIKNDKSKEVLLEIETGPEGGEPFTYEIPIEGDDNNTALQLAEERMKVLYKEQVKDGYTALSGQLAPIEPKKKVLGKKTSREAPKTINKKETVSITNKLFQ